MTNPKDIVQSRARKLWDKSRHGTLAMATGTGKSKIAVDRVIELLKEKTRANILLIVPTTRLRDSNWKEEFEKWGAGAQWDKITRSCYVSANKIIGFHWDLVVMDEAHNITPNNSEFFDQNTVKEVLGLTATPPRDLDKLALLGNIAPVCFIYTMDEAVTEGLVSPYNITIYPVTLDQHDKYIGGGTKDKPFKTTEQAQYNYLSKRIMQANYMGESAQKYSRIARMTFMKNLRSKTKVAAQLISSLDPEERVLIFCGSIAQAEELLPGQTYHSKTNDHMLNAFIAGTINKLACVDAMNEGINIPLIDRGIVVRFDSNPKNLIQRIGRIVRKREGHIAKIDILVVSGTVDEEWIAKGLVDFDKSNIGYQDIRNVTKVVA